jgi:AcrR family transcriptional regulator
MNMVSVNRGDAPVKGSRRYDASGRRSRAERARLAIIEAARQRFLQVGYAATTVTDVASAADVSPETIYKTFRSKAGLLRAVREAALAGAGTSPAEQRSDAALESLADPRDILTAWSRLACEVAPRVAPILLLVRAAAAADPELVPLDRELDRSRLDRNSHLAAELFRRGHVRPGLTTDRVRDVLYTFTSPELFHVLIEDRGWPVEDFGRFLADGMIAAILPAAAQ